MKNTAKKTVKWCACVSAAMLVATMVVAGCNKPAASKEPEKKVSLKMAVAANMKFAFQNLVEEFHKANPGIEVAPTYGSSGNFVAQIKEGAPFDLFLSANMEFPRKLVEEGMGTGDGVFAYAVGRLVLWVPEGSGLNVEALGMEILRNSSIKKIALANPQHAPYGLAAVEAMKAAGLLTFLEGRLVYGKDISETAHFVKSGAADIGFLALSLAMAPEMQGGRYWELPASTYPKLEQGGMIVVGTKNLDAAVKFKKFLLGASGQDLLKRSGY